MKGYKCDICGKFFQNIHSDQNIDKSTTKEDIFIKINLDIRRYESAGHYDNSEAHVCYSCMENIKDRIKDSLPNKLEVREI